MSAEYIRAALERAEHEMIDDPEPYYAHVPGLPGVWATGKTFEDCRNQLISVIEGWIVLGLRMGHPIPSMDGHAIDVSRSGCPSMRLPQTERLTITATHLDVSPDAFSSRYRPVGRPPYPASAGDTTCGSMLKKVY